jgi:hypothetical protein
MRLVRSTSVQRAAAAMEKIDIHELRFYDLHDSAVTIRDYFQNYALLVFLRHLA